MKISIPLNVIKAASYCVANNKDLRHYLRHVYFDFKHGEVNRLRLISTDGVILSAFQVDLVYEDPHDVSGILRGRRISKTYYDSFVSLMSNSGVLQSQCLKASIAISQMLSWLSHVKIASKNNWTKMG